MKIYYSVRNGGDGSAYPDFFESERLAEMDQELQFEGWGESCTGFLEIEGDNIKVKGVTTKEMFIQDLNDRIEDEDSEYFINMCKKFIKELNG